MKTYVDDEITSMDSYIVGNWKRMNFIAILVELSYLLSKFGKTRQEKNMKMFFSLSNDELRCEIFQIQNFQRPSFITLKGFEGKVS